MMTTLHEALARQADDIGPAQLDIDHLVGLGEQRLRRRRVVAVLGSAVAVVLVIALTFGGAALSGSSDNGQGPATNRHKAYDHNAPQVSHPQARSIVYNDDMTFLPGSEALIHVGTLNVGGREVQIDQTLHTVQGWAMVVTDAGAVYAQDDHSVWFTDGGPPRQIAGEACAGTYPWEFEGIMAGNAGPLVAWFDCAPASRGDLVVYDTSLGHEVVRHSIPSCSATKPAHSEYECMPDAVVGEHVYFAHFNSAGRLIDHQFRLDVSSDQVIPAGPETYAEDLRTHPRALVTGDSWQTGTPTEGADFRAIGSRLVPGSFDGAVDEFVLARAFDTATGQPVRFRLPPGYHPDPAAGFSVPGDTDASLLTDEFTLFEWLDDDTVALAQHGNNSVGDIITCHLSDGGCDLAVKGPPHDRHRIVPNADAYFPG
jgi:hypothetical protein